MRSFIKEYWGAIAIVTLGFAAIAYAQTDYAKGIDRPGLSPWIGISDTNQTEQYNKMFGN